MVIGVTLSARMILAFTGFAAMSGICGCRFRIVSSNCVPLAASSWAEEDRHARQFIYVSLAAWNGGQESFVQDTRTRERKFLSPYRALASQPGQPYSDHEHRQSPVALYQQPVALKERISTILESYLRSIQYV